MLSYRSRAFTLAEVLIALSILGVVAMLTIPQILHSNQLSTKKAIFKETFAVLNQLASDAYRVKRSQTVPQRTSEILSRLNALKICPNDAQMEGCVSGAPPVEPDVDTATNTQYTRVTFTAPTWWQRQPGAVLKNGAVLLFATDCAGDGCLTDDHILTILVDWNGSNKGINRGKIYNITNSSNNYVAPDESVDIVFLYHNTASKPKTVGTSSLLPGTVGSMYQGSVVPQQYNFQHQILFE